MWESFAKSVIALLAEKQVPAEHFSDVLASYLPEEAKVLAHIVESESESFASANRGASLDKLIREQKRQAIQKAISAMKQEVQLAGAREPELVPELLQQIMALHKSLSALQVSLD